MTDPNGNKTTYEYDGRGQLSKVIDAQGGTRTMNYDTGGNVIEVIFTDAEDKILKHKRMEVDGYGRVVETVQTVQIGEAVEMGTGRDDGSPRPGEIITQYAYNLNDKLIKVTDPKGQSETMEYDALNRLVKQIDRLGNVTTKMYDGNGNIIVRSEE
jgi:YD repeat-containing protein